MASKPPHSAPAPHNRAFRIVGETRRRVKVIGRLPGERSALSLLFAVLERASGGWRGITYTPADVRLLQMIRRDLGFTISRKERP